MMNREAIYSALFAQLTTAAGFTTFSRRLKHWEEVPAVAQPALFQVQKSEEVKARTSLPPKVLMRLDLYIYSTTTDPAASPAIAMNALLDAVAGALQPANGQLNQTLGGLVDYCRVTGTIETDEGALGAQAVAVVPIEILA
jgi:hypothetical protein